MQSYTIQGNSILPYTSKLLIVLYRRRHAAHSETSFEFLSIFHPRGAPVTLEGGETNDSEPWVFGEISNLYCFRTREHYLAFCIGLGPCGWDRG